MLPNHSNRKDGKRASRPKDVLHKMRKKHEELLQEANKVLDDGGDLSKFREIMKNMEEVSNKMSEVSEQVNQQALEKMMKAIQK